VISETSYSPIALFVYNRPEILSKTLNSLKKNPEIGKTKLYVFSDGPRKPEDERQVELVRALVKKISWCKELELIELKENRGLAESIVNGVTTVLNKHDSIIVLEDDLILAPGFLKYMNDGLRIYMDCDEVISISGYMYPVNQKLPETFFLNIADCQGWGTWKRGWQMFERNGEQLLSKLSSELSYKFDLNGNYGFTKLLQEQVDRKNFSWAILWYASAFLKNKLSLYPHLSLVNHIGKNGTNYSSDPFLDKTNMTKNVKVLPTPTLENIEARNAVIDFFAARKVYINTPKSKTFFKRLFIK
jgi:hypothetical protein